MNEDDAGMQGGDEAVLAGARSAPARPAPVIALRMEELLGWTAARVADFPRAHKFTLGDRLVETCLDATALLVEAAYARHKRELLGGASRALVRARVLARVAHAQRCWTERQMLHFSRESDEVGRMLGGWMRQQAGAERGTKHM